MYGCHYAWAFTNPLKSIYKILFHFFLQFVAQPNCQQLLATLWYDGFPGWRRRHWAVKLVMCFIIGLLFPVFSLVYLLAPKSTLGLFIKKPFIKFICHTASYLTFLFLLLLASQHIARTNLHIQGPPPTVVEWMILPWVLGEYDWMCHGDVGNIACMNFVNEVYYEIVCKSALYWYSSNIQVLYFYLTLNPSNKVLQLIKS